MHTPMQGADMRPKLGSLDLNHYRGWFLPSGKRTAHFYLEGRSLCGRYHAPYGTTLSNAEHHARHNCITCMKSRDKRYQRES